MNQVHSGTYCLQEIVICLHSTFNTDNGAVSLDKSKPYNLNCVTCSLEYKPSTTSHRCLRLTDNVSGILWVTEFPWESSRSQCHYSSRDRDGTRKTVSGSGRDMNHNYSLCVTGIIMILYICSSNINEWNLIILSIMPAFMSPVLPADGVVLSVICLYKMSRDVWLVFPLIYKEQWLLLQINCVSFQCLLWLIFFILYTLINYH